MSALFIVYCAVIGILAATLIILISNKVSSKRFACTLCCLLGMVVAVTVTILFVHLGDSVSIGVLL